MTPSNSLVLSETTARLRGTWARILMEWAVIIVVAYLYGGAALLDFDATQLQQTGEHNESATLPLLAEIGLRRYGEIPLWNPYMLTGFPHVGDFINHFWNPIATLSVIIWGGINGMKVSIFLSFVLAGIGQWLFAHMFGLRGFTRLWAGLMYMLSGGLALLWRVGWYELLLGAAWFPWCFASLWWALRRRDWTSIALTAICIGMVLTTGGGYYPFYLLVCLSVVTAASLLLARLTDRWQVLARATAIAALSAALAAVILLPMIDGWRYTYREAGRDEAQGFSQPISYALINYLVADPNWFGVVILGKPSGWTWFYIGWLPITALAVIPLLFSYARWHRPAILTLAALTIVLLAWHANRYTPVKYIYDWIPFLYTLRFSNRLLIVIASPLIVLAGLGLQWLFIIGRQWSRKVAIVFSRRDDGRQVTLSPKWAVDAALLIVILAALYDVFATNRGFTFDPSSLNTKARAAFRWLKAYDSSLYYTNVGGGAIYGDWIALAYNLEMPIINFDYGRRLISFDRQRAQEAPFFASAKYIFALPDQPHSENAQLLKDFDGVQLWYDPNALPFAFSADPAFLQSYTKLTPTEASALDVHFDGPNRIVVTGEPTHNDDYLVALASNYPGWQVYIDGQPAQLTPANDYLGAVMIPGSHTYTFVFQPMKHYLGLIISLLTIGLILILIARDLRTHMIISRLRLKTSSGNVQRAPYDTLSGSV